MFSATGGVNTHKGAVFSLGLLCAALGNLSTAEEPFFSYEALLRRSGELARFAVADF